MLPYPANVEGKKISPAFQKRLRVGGTISTSGRRKRSFFLSKLYIKSEYIGTDDHLGLDITIEELNVHLTPTIVFMSMYL